MILRIFCLLPLLVQTCLSAAASAKIQSINVNCEEDGMGVDIQFDQAFHGVIFSKNFFSSADCNYVSNPGQDKVHFTIRAGKCGTLMGPPALSDGSASNRTRRSLEKKLLLDDKTKNETRQARIDPFGMDFSKFDHMFNFGGHGGAGGGGGDGANMYENSREDQPPPEAMEFTGGASRSDQPGQNGAAGVSPDQSAQFAGNQIAAVGRIQQPSFNGQLPSPNVQIPQAPVQQLAGMTSLEGNRIGQALTQQVNYAQQPLNSVANGNLGGLYPTQGQQYQQYGPTREVAFNGAPQPPSPPNPYNLQAGQAAAPPGAYQVASANNYQQYQPNQGAYNQYPQTVATNGQYPQASQSAAVPGAYQVAQIDPVTGEEVTTTLAPVEDAYAHPADVERPLMRSGNYDSPGTSYNLPGFSGVDTNSAGYAVPSGRQYGGMGMGGGDQYGMQQAPAMPQMPNMGGYGGGQGMQMPPAPQMPNMGGYGGGQGMQMPPAPQMPNMGGYGGGQGMQMPPAPQMPNMGGYGGGQGMQMPPAPQMPNMGGYGGGQGMQMPPAPQMPNMGGYGGGQGMQMPPAPQMPNMGGYGGGQESYGGGGMQMPSAPQMPDMGGYGGGQGMQMPSAPQMPDAGGYGGGMPQMPQPPAELNAFSAGNQNGGNGADQGGNSNSNGFVGGFASTNNNAASSGSREVNVQQMTASKGLTAASVKAATTQRSAVLVKGNSALLSAGENENQRFPATTKRTTSTTSSDDEGDDEPEVASTTTTIKQTSRRVTLTTRKVTTASRTSPTTAAEDDEEDTTPAQQQQANQNKGTPTIVSQKKIESLPPLRAVLKPIGQSKGQVESDLSSQDQNARVAVSLPAQKGGSVSSGSLQVTTGYNGGGGGGAEPSQPRDQYDARYETQKEPNQMGAGQEPAFGYKEPAGQFNNEPKFGYNEPKFGYNTKYENGGADQSGGQEPAFGYREPAGQFNNEPKFGYNEPSGRFNQEPKFGYNEPAGMGGVDQSGGGREPAFGYNEPKGLAGVDQSGGGREPAFGYKEPSFGYNEPQGGIMPENGGAFRQDYSGGPGANMGGGGGLAGRAQASYGGGISNQAGNSYGGSVVQPQQAGSYGAGQAQQGGYNNGPQQQNVYGQGGSAQQGGYDSGSSGQNGSPQQNSGSSQQSTGQRGSSQQTMGSSNSDQQRNNQMQQQSSSSQSGRQVAVTSSAGAASSNSGQQQQQQFANSRPSPGDQQSSDDDLQQQSGDSQQQAGSSSQNQNMAASSNQQMQKQNSGNSNQQFSQQGQDSSRVLSGVQQKGQSSSSKKSSAVASKISAVSAADSDGGYIENVIIIQNDPLVQEVWDAARAIRCEWRSNYKKTVSSKERIALTEVQTMRFAGDDIEVWMEIQAGKGPWADPVSNIVPIGHTMTLLIGANDPKHEFDLRVGRCIAHDGSGKSQIDLTDDNGCVVRDRIMSKFDKAKNWGAESATIAFAHFSAFKFPETTKVFIECDVEVCKRGCAEQCTVKSKAIAGKSDSLSRRVAVGSGSSSSSTSGAQLDLSTPAKLGEKFRRKRSVKTERDTLSVKNHYEAVAPADLSFNIDIRIPNSNGTIVYAGVRKANEENYCMSRGGFGVGVGILVTAVIVSTLSSIFLCLRFRNQRPLLITE